MRETIYTLLMIALILAIIVGVAAVAQLIYGSAYWQELGGWIRFIWIMGGWA